jgi:3'(2'), 5'-bisphosphate nucleotidase
MSDLEDAARVALEAARDASHSVMRVYESPFGVEYKSKDDPVTLADREANALLSDRLSGAFPGVPVVAEESPPSSYAGFAGAESVWFVDPLDGTREFVAKNGEFAVMVGLSRGGRAVLGVVVAPSWERAFVGIVGSGAYEIAEDGSRVQLHTSEHASLAGSSVVLSRSRILPKLAEFATAIGARQAVRHGSSGLKGVLVATGTHDIYLQPGLAGMRWDACAAEALVVAAGGRFTDVDGNCIDYADPDLVNRRGLVATNGRLHDAVLDALRAARDA